MTMFDLLTWWCKRLELPPSQTEVLRDVEGKRYGWKTSNPAISQTYETTQPWVVYTYGRTHDKGWPFWRSSRVLGRAAIGMECAVCGKLQIIVLKIPRFGPLPVVQPRARTEFLLEHIHKDRGHPMSWVKPLMNANATGINLDMLAMRLEADLNRGDSQ
jgi:hypothetical protein